MVATEEVKKKKSSANWDVWPTPIEWLDDIAKICECSISTLHSVAKSLGVETVEHQGKLCWRLPSNVVPFQPCPCRYEAARGSAA